MLKGVAATLVAAGLLTGTAQAQGQASGQVPGQAWPQRAIMFVVPFAPGGGTDAFARPLAAVLDRQLGVRILIENKAGAGGTVGASFAAKQTADGYSFFIGAAHHTIAPAIYPRLDYDIEKDFIPIALLARPPQVISVHPKMAAKTLTDFITYARANPGKVNFASAGAGTTHQLSGELFKILTKTDLQHVPYRGAGPAMQDLLAGHVDMMFDGLGTSATQIAGGQLRGLAVADAKRSPAIPDVPTAAEAGLPGFEVSTWYAIWAPRGTPAPIVERMKTEIATAFTAPEIKEAWARNGSEVPTLAGEAFGAFVHSEIARWGKVVSEAGVRLE